MRVVSAAGTKYCSDPFLYPVWVHNLFINLIWYSCHLFCFLHQLWTSVSFLGHSIRANEATTQWDLERWCRGASRFSFLDHSDFSLLFFCFVLLMLIFYFYLILKPDHTSQSQEHISVKIVISPFYVQLCEWPFSRSWLDFWIKKNWVTFIKICIVSKNSEIRI